ncbi:MAG: FlhC family transcriptional regulator [Gammaproteobacteria bacterium]
MRVTDDRYAGERDQFDLAMRLIHHQARTHIITQCTGFSPDRVRKLYGTYFKGRRGRRVSRHRGKSPTSVEVFVKNPRCQAQASLLAHVLIAWGLVRLREGLAAEAGRRDDRLAFGRAFCEAYEEFRRLEPDSGLSFEQAWNLFTALTQRRSLLLFDCEGCGTLYVQDALALDRRRCPACRVVRCHRRGEIGTADA